MTDYYEEDLESERNCHDDFDNRTWEVVETVPDGFAKGALFTRRDIAYMTKMIPCLEGTVFRNIRTGKERRLKNKECNMRNIINLARVELKSTDYEHLLYALNDDRESIALLISRINKARLGRDSFIFECNFYKMLTEFYGEEQCK